MDPFIKSEDNMPWWPLTSVWLCAVPTDCQNSYAKHLYAHYSNYGNRCFVATGPKPRNGLPAYLRQANISFQRFKRLLKTFFFGCWDHGAFWLTVKAAPHKFSYLFTYLYVIILPPGRALPRSEECPKANHL